MKQNGFRNQKAPGQAQVPTVNNIGMALIAKMEEKRKDREQNKPATAMAPPGQRQKNAGRPVRSEVGDSNELARLREEIQVMKLQWQEDAQTMKDILQEVVKLHQALEKKDSNTETISPEAAKPKDVSQKRSATDLAELDREEVKRVRVEILEEDDHTETVTNRHFSKTISQSKAFAQAPAATAMLITPTPPGPVVPSSSQTVPTTLQEENPTKFKVKVFEAEKCEQTTGSPHSCITLSCIDDVLLAAALPTPVPTSIPTPALVPAGSKPDHTLRRNLRSDTAEHSIKPAERIQRQSPESVASAKMLKAKTLPPRRAQSTPKTVGESTREEAACVRRVIPNQKIDRKNAKVGHVNKSKLSISFRIELDKGSGSEIQTCTKNFPGSHQSFDWTSKAEIATLNEWRQKVIFANCPRQGAERWLESEKAAIQEILQDKTRPQTQMTILGITNTYNKKMKNVTQRDGEKGAEGDFVLKQNRKAPIRSRSAISHWLVKLNWQSQIMKNSTQEVNQDPSHEDRDFDMEGEDN